MPRQGQSVLSTVYMYVDATPFGGQDLTGDPVVVALTMIGASSQPASGDWHPAEIIPGNTVRILSGPNTPPGGLKPSIGKYEVWVDLTDNPERPVAPVGTWTVVP